MSGVFNDNLLDPSELRVAVKSYQTTHWLNNDDEECLKGDCRWGSSCGMRDKKHNTRENHPQPTHECPDIHCNNNDIFHVRVYSHKNVVKGSCFYGILSSQNASRQSSLNQYETPCKFAHDCGNFDEEHRAMFLHPKQTPCKHGLICRDFGKEHCEKFSHPRRTVCKFGKQCKHQLGTSQEDKKHNAEFVHPKLDCMHGKKCWDQSPAHREKYDHP